MKETSGAPRNPQGQIGAKRIDTHRDGRRDYPSRQSNRRRRLNSIDSARGEAYLPQTSPPVYQRLRDLVSLALASGQSTILDAVHLRHEQEIVVSATGGHGGKRNNAGRDESQSLAIRLDAAKSCAPYIHPRLNAIDHAGAGGSPIVIQISGPIAGA